MNISAFFLGSKMLILFPSSRHMIRLVQVVRFVISDRERQAVYGKFENPVRQLQHLRMGTLGKVSRLVVVDS